MPIWGGCVLKILNKPCPVIIPAQPNKKGDCIMWYIIGGVCIALIALGCYAGKVVMESFDEGESKETEIRG